MDMSQLIEIVAKADIDWPEQFPYMAQDEGGAIFAYAKSPHLRHESVWSPSDSISHGGNVYYVTEKLPRADDWNTTVLTRGDFIRLGGKV